MHRNDIRVRELGVDLRLLDETRQQLARHFAARQVRDLQRHLAAQLGIEAEQHLAHGSAADLAAHLDAPAPQRLFFSCVGVGAFARVLLAVSHGGPATG